MPDTDTSMRELLRGLPSLAGPLPGFDPATAPGNPYQLFESWLRAAIDAGVREPHAMTLSTVDEHGHPSARMLILKNLDDRGYHFAFSSASPKGHDLAATPWAALTFYWPALARQVRVTGRVELAPAESSAEDFRARADYPRAIALTGRQSRPMAGFAEFDKQVGEQRDRLTLDPRLVDPQWTVGVLHPGEIEFWQGDEDRKHIRLRYRQTDHDWTREQLWP